MSQKFQSDSRSSPKEILGSRAGGCQYRSCNCLSRRNSATLSVMKQGADHFRAVFLSDADAQDASLFGTKAASLARLGQMGFRVPEGMAISLPLGQDTPRGDRLVETILRDLGDLVSREGVSFAVRSSSPQEDGDVHSFAGQFESVLGVDPRGNLEGAIERCRRSA